MWPRITAEQNGHTPTPEQKGHAARPRNSWVAFFGSGSFSDGYYLASITADAVVTNAFRQRVLFGHDPQEAVSNHILGVTNAFRQRVLFGLG